MKGSKLISPAHIETQVTYSGMDKSTKISDLVAIRGVVGTGAIRR